jgi:hypothetical protein
MLSFSRESGRRGRNRQTLGDIVRLFCVLSQSCTEKFAGLQLVINMLFSAENSNKNFPDPSTHFGARVEAAGQMEDLREGGNFTECCITSGGSFKNSRSCTQAVDVSSMRHDCK